MASQVIQARKLIPVNGKSMGRKGARLKGSGRSICLGGVGFLLAADISVAQF
jgi:hypothetical protein